MKKNFEKLEQLFNELSIDNDCLLSLYERDLRTTENALYRVDRLFKRHNELKTLAFQLYCFELLNNAEYDKLDDIERDVFQELCDFKYYLKCQKQRGL